MKREPNPRCSTCQGSGMYYDYDPMQGREMYACPCTKDTPCAHTVSPRSNVVHVDFRSKR